MYIIIPSIVRHKHLLASPCQGCRIVSTRTCNAVRPRGAEGSTVLTSVQAGGISLHNNHQSKRSGTVLAQIIGTYVA